MNDYKLSDEEHNKVFEKIEAHYLPKSQPVEKPLAIITGGQPGAGKSGLTELAKARMKEGGFVLVDADKMRSFHPSWQRALQADDKNAADLTHSDAGAWAGKLLRLAVESSRNVIIDQTSRDPESFASLAGRLQASGYRVEAHFMASHPEVSAQRIVTRYENEKAQFGVGRFSNADKHDAAFAGLGKTVEAIEPGKLVDALALYNSEGRQIYSNALENGRWRSGATASAVFHGETSRALTPGDAQRVADGYERAAELMRQRGAPVADVRSSQALALAVVAEAHSRSMDGPAFVHGLAPLAPGRFDLAHLQSIHAQMFKDSPEYNPGELRGDVEGVTKMRSLETSGYRYEVQYASGQGLAERVTDILERAGGPDGFRGLDAASFAEKMAGLYADLDRQHPFSEGNSRTLREFTRQLAEEAGFKLDWGVNMSASYRDALYVARDVAVVDRTYPGLTAERADALPDKPEYRQEYEAWARIKAPFQKMASLKSLVSQGLEKYTPEMAYNELPADRAAKVSPLAGELRAARESVRSELEAKQFSPSEVETVLKRFDERANADLSRQSDKTLPSQDKSEDLER